jgi:hypothetical protein
MADIELSSHGVAKARQVFPTSLVRHPLDAADFRLRLRLFNFIAQS